MDAGYGQLPNVAYARTTEQLHNAMIWLGVELQRRTEVADRYVNAKGDILGDVGPPLWIIAEELNLAMPRLKQYWAAIRDKDDPKRSPALDGMAAVSFAGRAVRMHLIVIGQMLTAASLGGGDVRENIGVRMMARYTANSWKMQTDLPMPPPSDVPGRVQIIAVGHRARGPGAADGLRAVPRAGRLGHRDAVPAGHARHRPGVACPTSAATYIRASELGFVLGQGGPPGRPPGTLTLREATAEGLFPSLAAARKAVQRRALEPAGRDGDRAPLLPRRPRQDAKERSMTDSDERPETWKPVAPMDGCTFSGYEASDKGRYRSIDRKHGNRQLRGKVLATRRNDDGYVLVNIRCDSTDPDHNRVHTFSGHKVDALPRSPGAPEPGQEACHSRARARVQLVARGYPVGHQGRQHWRADRRAQRSGPLRQRRPDAPAKAA